MYMNVRGRGRETNRGVKRESERDTERRARCRRYYYI
jgi:hypothetical protein